MKNILIVIIKLYWKFIPKTKRRKCLFKISCSNYVYGITKSQGLIKGIEALNFRVCNCNPRYNILKINDKKILVSATNTVFKEDELNDTLLN